MQESTLDRKKMGRKPRKSPGKPRRRRRPIVVDLMMRIPATREKLLVWTQ
jgi:hypothetical protein